MVHHPRLGQEQYQSTMDAPRGMTHPSVMEPAKDRKGAKHQLLSVVVDDDESVRESLPDLLREIGFAAKAFASAQEFLASGCVERTRCLILDVAMPGMSGPELQQELKRRGHDIPIIFITGRKDETVRARVLKHGAAAFLLKPFTEGDLLAAINAALPGVPELTG